ncbi:hypothetical protein TcasGA2_TC009823 [Tribolium castaneum]|uniref:Uncharacterized protein n=1 Tax=Tribolium castaneum TaxID=7070 RepID=D6WPV4_TRICA|nr:hypothetical protein TcasGA2_TC009823 [Tribolium castaneum]
MNENGRFMVMWVNYGRDQSNVTKSVQRCEHEMSDIRSAVYAERTSWYGHTVYRKNQS